MTRKLLSILLAAASAAELPPFSSAYAATPQRHADNIAYIRANGAWEGYWPHGDEYVEYAVTGSAELNDGFHILLKPGLGLMLTFADKRRFGPGADLLEAHKQWELAYWRKRAGRVDDHDRSDLAGGRSDVRVTELDLVQDGRPTRIYLIGAAAPDGVFAFGISPVSPGDDALVRRIVDSIRVVRHPLDIVAEEKRAMAKIGATAAQH
jgi:hypothetical protein